MILINSKQRSSLNFLVETVRSMKERTLQAFLKNFSSKRGEFLNNEFSTYLNRPGPALITAFKILFSLFPLGPIPSTSIRMVARALIPWWHLARAINRVRYALFSKNPKQNHREKIESLFITTKSENGLGSRWGRDRQGPSLQYSA